ncbi:MAG: isoprenylcysteine carboxylmethyltransferase family protein [Pontiellaceae bacterium]|nr:isoprenylcysteine carboxylmethyltransferase family protein [Pontiellaceae bacterium]MBN2783512.1 isoprenylcysteine carboxylmethyltransferase family protein [Pontiellaceae bacterium]
MFNLIADAVTSLCVLAMLAAIAFNFLNTGKSRSFRERRSPVATASMTAFFLLLYLTIRFRWSAMNTDQWIFVRSAGLGLMLFGAAFNIWGRIFLKTNWADHVRIYDDQQLVTDGPYRIVRHPLYASIIWMFFGAALAYLNPLAAVENALIFIPAMVYRSNLEEKELARTFGDAYLNYRNKIGRFFPRIGARPK